MRHFTRLLDVGVLEQNVYISQRQDLFLSAGVDHVSEIPLRVSVADEPRLAVDQPAAGRLPALKRLAQATMTMVNGVQLGSVAVVRINKNSQASLASQNLYFRHCLVVLSAAPPNVMLVSGEETVPAVPGQSWLMDLHQDASMIINRSEDDAMVMLSEVRLDP